jgi:hypothetical protein
MDLLYPMRLTMNKATIFAVIALITAPSFAFSQGCSKGEAKSAALICAVGMVWDAAKETCVTPINS